MDKIASKASSSKKSSISASSLENLRRFAFKAASAELPGGAKSQQNLESSQPRKLSCLEELARCGKSLSQMSRNSEPARQETDDSDFVLPFD